jgi:hypothetical protein
VERGGCVRRLGHRRGALKDPAREPPELLDDLLVEGVLAATCIRRRSDTVELIKQGANESRTPSKLSRP